MSRTALVNARILSDGQWLEHHAVIIRNGQIEALVPENSLSAEISTYSCNNRRLLPGFIDTQVNGGGGVLFNDQPNVDGIRTIAEAHRKFGTTALLPTLISDDLSVVAQAIAAVDAAIQQNVPGIIGIHLEGPFLNAGKRGIHDAGKFRTLDAEAIALLSSLKHGKTLVTLAPECAAPGTIRALVERGVIVAAGHTLATYADMQRAIAEGLRGVTHLFNAMSQMESRAPGVVGAALAHHLYCGIILDGHHVHEASARIAAKALGAEKLMLVTDAMSTVGTERKSFLLGNKEIHVQENALRDAQGTLAGSTLDMATACRNAMVMLKIDLAQASIMASTTAADFLGLASTYGKIAPGYQADLLLLDEDLHCAATWSAGVRRDT